MGSPLGQSEYSRPGDLPDNTTLNDWATTVQREMHKLWKKYPGSDYKSGYEVATQVPEDPSKIKTAIIGLNPGDGSDDGEYHKYMKPRLGDNPEFSLPTAGEGQYARETNPTASDAHPRIRDRLFVDHQELLDHAIETNLNFLRTDDGRDHSDLCDDMPASHQQAYQDLCRTAVRDMLRLGNPELVVGFKGGNQTATDLCDHLGLTSESRSDSPHTYDQPGKPEIKIYVADIQEWPNSTVITLSHHLSGWRGWSEEQLQFLADTVPPIIDSEI